MGKLLVTIAAMTSIAIGLSAYRFIDQPFNANIGFLAGFLALIFSFYFIKTRN